MVLSSLSSLGTFSSGWQNIRLGRVALVLFLCGFTFASASVVSTIDGRKLEGNVQFTNGALLVMSGDSNTLVAASNILRVQFTSTPLPPTSRGTGNGLLGFYFGNTNATGAVIVRLDQDVDFDWRDNAPMLGVPRDGFSVRWSGYIDPPVSDTFTLHFAANDHGRLYVDEQLLAAHASVEGFAETNVTVTFKAGERRKLRVEVVDASGSARARLSWSSSAIAKTVVPADRLHAASFDPEHVAEPSELAGTQGLLATYFNDDEFRGSSHTRLEPEVNFHWNGSSPAPGISSNRFSVRWTGNLTPTNSGDYLLHVSASVPMRLFLNDRLISNPWTSLEQVMPVKFAAGERQSLRLEMRITNSVMPVRLMWSGNGMSKNIVARQHLTPGTFPVEPDANDERSLPRGVFFTSGAVIDAPLASATATALRLRGHFGKQPIPTSKIARIHLKPLSPQLAAAIPKGRPGVLLRNRDFIDGEFEGIAGGRVRVSSVLYGNRSFDVNKDVIAIVLRHSEPPPWNYAVTSRDGTVLYGRAVRMDGAGVSVVQEPAHALPAGELVEITHRSARE
jgi:hypothetical protein